MKNTKNLLLFVSLLLSYAMIIVKSDKATGASMKIILQKQPTSELDTTILNSGNLTLITGDSPLPPSDGLEGELVPFNPLNACQSGRIEEQFSQKELVNVIALVSKDASCSIETKITNVSKVKNVIGILIYNDKGDGPLKETLPLKEDAKSSIPGFVINYSTGEQLMNIYKKFKNQNNKNKRFWIKVILQYVEPNNALTTVLQWSLIGIIMLLAIAFAISVVMHLRMRERANAISNNQTSNHSENDLMAEINLEPVYHIQLNKERLSKLKVRVFKKEEGNNNGNRGGGEGEKSKNNNENENHHDNSSNINNNGINREIVTRAPIEYEVPSNETCPICLDDFITGETLNELACTHCYHIGCIQPWLLNRSPLCPMCKEDVRDSFRKKLAKENVINENENRGEAFFF